MTIKKAGAQTGSQVTNLILSTHTHANYAREGQRVILRGIQYTYVCDNLYNFKFCGGESVSDFQARPLHSVP